MNKNIKTNKYSWIIYSGLVLILLSAVWIIIHGLMNFPVQLITG